MLTQPVLVARLSTHAWALGKGPALFRPGHRDGEKLWKSWVLPQERACMCYGSRATTLGMGIAKMPEMWKMYFFFFLLNYQINSLPLTLLHLLSFFQSLHFTSSLPLSSDFLRAAVHGAESFITHFVHVFFKIPGSSPCPALVALQKQCIQFVSTKSVPATWQSTSKEWSLSFKAFQKKSCR